MSGKPRYTLPSATATAIPPSEASCPTCTARRYAAPTCSAPSSSAIQASVAPLSKVDADAPDNLREEHHRKNREETLEHKPRADQKHADDY